MKVQIGQTINKKAVTTLNKTKLEDKKIKENNYSTNFYLKREIHEKRNNID